MIKSIERSFGGLLQRLDGDRLQGIVDSVARQFGLGPRPIRREFEAYLETLGSREGLQKTFNSLATKFNRYPDHQEMIQEVCKETLDFFRDLDVSYQNPPTIGDLFRAKRVNLTSRLIKLGTSIELAPIGAYGVIQALAIIHSVNPDDVEKVFGVNGDYLHLGREQNQASQTE